MFVSKGNDVVLVRTPFKKGYDLVQKFRGCDNQSLDYNSPIDVQEAGLIDNSKWDCYHLDIPFNISNDEATPPVVNGCHIGANHGEFCAVSVYSENHNKTLKDVGAVYKDSQGVNFTLIKVDTKNALTFVSDNVGESVYKYDFKRQIDGHLTYVGNGNDVSEVKVTNQRRVFLLRSNRCLKKEFYVSVNGKLQELFGSAQCDYFEIHEDYDIINPATVAPALQKARPKNGFSVKPDLADYGDAMISVRQIYRVLNDGTILSIFKHDKLQPVLWQEYVGIMYQEKLNVYGGGIYRYIPKLLPFTTQEGSFDFSNGINIFESYPKEKWTDKSTWLDKDNPSDRVLDYFKDKNGKNKLAFACGFLPIKDGEPKARKNIQSSFHIKGSRKMYPFIKRGDISSTDFVGYKKFFIPSEQNHSIYAVEYDGKTYVYANIYQQGQESIAINGRAKLIEKYGDIVWTQDCSALTVSGSNGIAVFEINNN